jgi:hypothetical protein
MGHCRNRPLILTPGTRRGMSARGDVRDDTIDLRGEHLLIAPQP